MSDNLEIFKVKCQQCKREIVDEMIYYKHPELGFVCEACPAFEAGGIEVDNTIKKSCGLLIMDENTLADYPPGHWHIYNASSEVVRVMRGDIEVCSFNPGAGLERLNLESE